MHHDVEILARKNRADRCRFAQIHFVQSDPIRDRREVAALYFRIVAIIKVVEDHNLVTVREQLVDQV